MLAVEGPLSGWWDPALLLGPQPVRRTGPGQWAPPLLRLSLGLASVSEEPLFFFLLQLEVKNCI